MAHSRPVPLWPQPSPPICCLSGRFLRDYDALFPVADDVSLLQQASSVLYPSHSPGDGTWPDQARGGLLGPRGAEEGFPENTQAGGFPRAPAQARARFLMQPRCLAGAQGASQTALAAAM